MLRFRISSAFVLMAVMSAVCTCTAPVQRQELPDGWPPVSHETRPWTRWWWHGSALTKEGITSEMEAYQEAGIGGLEITPIYGVYGEEENFVDFLSPQWLDMLMHVLEEADRLDMGIDMATGTGWPFGGPWISSADACKNLQHKIYTLKGGESLKENIELVQDPYLRMVGNNIYKTDTSAGGATRVMNTSEVKIADLTDPVEGNKDLQKLAIDQVQFSKPLKLSCLVGFDGRRQVVDLTSKVDASGKLDWTAPPGDWKLYAVFEGFHGKMVERAGPGGEGNVIDHFSGRALANYLNHFDKAFEDYDLDRLRAFFNDSYEVDDARGAADFTPALFDEFRKRRGYDLKEELPALFGDDTADRSRRVLCDYRETLSDLLLEQFTIPWRDWAHNRDAIVRNQAHGAPSNILDLYAAVDIPEIEGTEPLRFKMAASSGNVTGKRLISAEAGTWLNEHFLSSLGDIREALDNFMLHGVNHIVYHGTCYSPPDDPWPGRLFYAAVHLNPRNPQWADFDALNAYATRCQSFLQNSSADNDVLLYYPIYDRFSTPGNEMVEHFDGIGGFKGSSFEQSAELLLQRGFGFDYISDKQISGTAVENNLLRTSGNSYYKVLVVPECDYIPVRTMEKILDMAEKGAQVFFVGRLPRTFSGLADMEKNEQRFAKASERLMSIEAKSGSGRKTVRIVDNLSSALIVTGARRETMYDHGFQCVRKKGPGGEAVYFIKNKSSKYFEGWLQIAADSEHLAIFDPVTGRSGRAKVRKVNSRTEVYLQLERSQTLIVSGVVRRDAADFSYHERDGESIALSGKWQVTFATGGPQLPLSFESDSLVYWTSRSDSSYRNFSGTGTYALVFPAPEKHADRWLLEIDSVKGSAEVLLNGKSLGHVLGPVYKLELAGSDLQDENRLEIQVSNLMANRIIYMDRNNIFWKKFYNVNFPSRFRENSWNNIFNAARWNRLPSGAQGRVTLQPLK